MGPYVQTLVISKFTFETGFASSRVLQPSAHRRQPRDLSTGMGPDAMDVTANKHLINDGWGMCGSIYYRAVG